MNREDEYLCNAKSILKTIKRVYVDRLYTEKECRVIANCYIEFFINTEIK